MRWNRQPRNFCIASSFGLCAGLLRQRDIAPNGLIRSPNFKSVVSVINAISLDLETSKAPIDSGGKIPRDQPSRILIDSLQAELSTLQDQIKKIESQIEEKSPGDSISLSASSPASTKSCCSSPTCSSRSSPKPTTSSPSSSASSSSIEDIKSTMMGSTIKRRKIAKYCRDVMASFNDVSEKYQESLSSVLGNAFVFGNKEEKGYVRDTISEVVDLVMDAQGTKKGLSELLSSSTYDRIVKSMRVPDWALLYFKLQSRLPDSAWQTLLNLTQLGKSGVSTFFYFLNETTL